MLTLRRAAVGDWLCRKMIDRGSLFGLPAYRWIPAKSTVHVRYWAMLAPAERVPEALTWTGENNVSFES